MLCIIRSLPDISLKSTCCNNLGLIIKWKEGTHVGIGVSNFINNICCNLTQNRKIHQWYLRKNRAKGQDGNNFFSIFCILVSNYNYPLDINSVMLFYQCIAFISLHSSFKVILIPFLHISILNSDHWQIHGKFFFSDWNLIFKWTMVSFRWNCTQHMAASSTRQTVPQTLAIIWFLCMRRLILFLK